MDSTTENVNSEFDILTIVGNRPQFIKMAPVSAEIAARGYKEFIIHTGQHYDDNMSKVFFDELGIKEPDISLNISSGSHGKMTGEMLVKLEEILKQEKPKCILIYGDTNSTLAAALAAVKLHIPIAHVEAGPRIYDINTPEEINRIVADHAARLRFCPDLVSVQNLAKENITSSVYFAGDVMYDSYLRFSEAAKERSKIIETLKISNKEYALLTVHRPNNTDTYEALARIIELLTRAPIHVVFPVHPRTEASLRRFGLWDKMNEISNVTVIPAVGYLDILELVNNCRIVLTDSGGLQKEAFFAGKPVLILLYATPWPQIEESGWQKRCWLNDRINIDQVIDEIVTFHPQSQRPDLFGDGKAACKILDILETKEWL